MYWYFGDDRLYREIPIPIGRKPLTIADTLEFTFELVCATIQDWRDMIEKFKPTKRTSNRDLASAITTLAREMVAKLEAREENRLRHEAKIKRAKELELMPKKRSRRLEVKVCVYVLLLLGPTNEQLLPSLMNKPNDKSYWTKPKNKQS